jgi:uncharacterized protein YcbX
MEGTVQGMKHGTHYGYNMGCRCEECRVAERETQRAYRARKRLRPVPAHVHGTAQGYQGWYCRCDECREVQRAYMRQWKKNAASRETPDHVHGTLNGYTNWGCRCEECKAAQHRKYEQRKRRVKA